MMFAKLRARLANALSPSPPASLNAPHRFAAVRFFPPGVEPHVCVFDRENPAHQLAWDENARFYRSQVIATGGDHEALKLLETPL